MIIGQIEEQGRDEPGQRGRALALERAIDRALGLGGGPFEVDDQTIALPEDCHPQGVRAAEAVRLHTGVDHQLFLRYFRQKLFFKCHLALAQQVGETGRQLLGAVALEEFPDSERAHLERTGLGVDIVAEQIGEAAVPEEERLDVPYALAAEGDPDGRDEKALVVALGGSGRSASRPHASQVVVAPAHLEEGDEAVFVI